MIDSPRHDVSDGYSWRCRTCKTRKSIRDGSFFSKSRLTLQKWLLMIHLWSLETPVTDAIKQAEIDIRSGCDIYQWLREVCTTKLLQLPMILGGQGVGRLQFRYYLIKYARRVGVTGCVGGILIINKQIAIKSALKLWQGILFLNVI